MMQGSNDNSPFAGGGDNRSSQAFPSGMPPIYPPPAQQWEVPQPAVYASPAPPPYGYALQQPVGFVYFSLFKCTCVLLVSLFVDMLYSLLLCS